MGGGARASEDAHDLGTALPSQAARTSTTWSVPVSRQAARLTGVVREALAVGRSPLRLHLPAEVRALEGRPGMVGGVVAALRPHGVDLLHHCRPRAPGGQQGRHSGELAQNSAHAFLATDPSPVQAVPAQAGSLGRAPEERSPRREPTSCTIKNLAWLNKRSRLSEACGWPADSQRPRPPGDPASGNPVLLAFVPPRRPAPPVATLGADPRSPSAPESTSTQRRAPPPCESERSPPAGSSPAQRVRRLPRRRASASRHRLEPASDAASDRGLFSPGGEPRPSHAHTRSTASGMCQAASSRPGHVRQTNSSQAEGAGERSRRVARRRGSRDARLQPSPNALARPARAGCAQNCMPSRCPRNLT